MKRLSAGVAAMVFFCTFATSAQSEEVTIGEHSVNIPQDLSQESQNLVKQYAPAIPDLCPGFAKYQGEFESFSIQDNYNIDVVFKIPDAAGGIPGDFVAYGHTCYFGISRDGKKLVIPKSACQSVCLDRDMFDKDIENLVIPLK